MDNTAEIPSKKMKLEADESVMQEEEEEYDEDSEFSHPVPWQKIEAEGLDCDYAMLFTKAEADHLLKQLEEEVVYSTGTCLVVCGSMTESDSLFW